QKTYNVDKTRLVLRILSFVKVLVGKNNLKDYRGAGVEQTILTTIKCIYIDSESLLLLIF
ncbi:uncharacterized protein BDR25DRAFT_229034, partial [Lindgomyces ingoldianus]